MADYIDKQAIAEMLLDELNSGVEGDRIDGIGTAIACVDKIPAADVQPVRHGKWIKAQRKGITSYGDGFAECDKCHEVSWLGWNDKYCRNCGARMDEGSSNV